MTNDTRKTCTTCWRVADDGCTDEGTRRRETYRDKAGENKKMKRVRSKARKQENRTQGVPSN